MFRRTARLLVVLAALAAASAVGAGEARADLYFDFCPTVAANATLNLGASVPSVQATSNGGSYATGLCYRFVTDIFVPTSSSGGPGYYNQFYVGGGYADTATGPGWDLPLSQADCAAYAGYLRVYRKTIFSSDFTVLGGGRTHGAWVNAGPPFGSFCATVKDAGYVDLPAYSPPSLFGVTYRVAVGAKIGTTWKQVRAVGWHPPIIY